MFYGRSRLLGSRFRGLARRCWTCRFALRLVGLLGGSGFFSGFGVRFNLRFGGFVVPWNR